MNKQIIYFTKEGYAKLEQDLSDLRAKREPTVLRLQAAREMGDLSENGAYKAARFELSDIDHNIRRISILLKNGEIKEAKHDGRIGFGNKVILEKEGQKIEYLMVGKHESDPRQYKLSVESPLGTALLGKQKGEIVTIVAPVGAMKYKVIGIS